MTMSEALGLAGGAFARVAASAATAGATSVRASAQAPALIQVFNVVMVSPQLLRGLDHAVLAPSSGRLEGLADHFLALGPQRLGAVRIERIGAHAAANGQVGPGV